MENISSIPLWGNMQNRHATLTSSAIFGIKVLGTRFIQANDAGFPLTD